MATPITRMSLKMKTTLIRLSVITLFATLPAWTSKGASAQPASGNEFAADWALKMSNGDAGWLTLAKQGEAWSAELWTVGQTKKVSDIYVRSGEMTFTRQCRIGAPEFPGGPPTGKPVACQFVATVNGDSIRIAQQPSASPGHGPAIHVGKRNPPLPPKPDLAKVKFGAPVRLFNGVDLTGWKLSNPEQINGWKAIDGVLLNESPKESFEPFSRYGNLRTEREFGDVRLSIEFKVPPGGNSGIYVRGAYEVQVVDRDSRMQGINGVGSIFGRVAPSKNAGLPGGEWQRFVITIVNRHATVVLNGETVIDNAPILGNTNGAFQADVTAPGPLYLQGDHTAVSYRNIVIQPVIEP